MFYSLVSLKLKKRKLRGIKLAIKFENGSFFLIHCIFLRTKLKLKKRLRMEGTSLFYLLQNVRSLKNSGQAAEIHATW